MRTKLTTGDMYGKIILEYIEANASDELVIKINNGTKNMDQCMAYIKGEAKKQAKNGVAMIEDKEVYGWAIHFFEEDSITTKAETPAVNIAKPTVVKPEPKEEPKKQDKGQLEGQINLFDFLGGDQ